MKILEEFKSLIPPLSESEHALLEKSILNEGCRDPLVVWDGTLIDGHNRYGICTEHGVKFDTVERDFESGAHAALWMIDNQEARRNLTSMVKIELQLKKKPYMAAIAKERQKEAAIAGNKNRHTDSPVPANSPEPSGVETRDELAKAAGVGSNTVSKVEKLKETAGDALMTAARSGEISINVAADLATLPVDAQERAVVDGKGGALAVAKEIREARANEKHNHLAQGTGENEWYTPAQYIDAARSVMGAIDLDPASSEHAQATVKAKKYYTIDDSGLRNEWTGRVWLNPPYAQPLIYDFVEKLDCDYARGSVSEAILLTHNYTDTKWFHLAARHAAGILFTRGRIGFEDPEGKKAAPTQGQAFFYYGKNIEEFKKKFSQFGLLVTV